MRFSHSSASLKNPPNSRLLRSLPGHSGSSRDQPGAMSLFPTEPGFSARNRLGYPILSESKVASFIASEKVSDLFTYFHIFSLTVYFPSRSLRLCLSASLR
jgi:hypothetical protein